MPCWELFAEQPASYRDAVLPPDCEARLAVEAATSFGWERWIGTRGDIVSIERFGASAPGATVLEQLGFTPENVAARARVLLERPSTSESDRKEGQWPSRGSTSFQSSARASGSTTCHAIF